MADKKAKKGIAYTTIKDEVLSPYYIKQDNYNFTVYKEPEKAVSHHPSVRDCLNKIIGLKNKDITEGQTLTLKDYIECLTEIKQEVLDAIPST